MIEKPDQAPQHTTSHYCLPPTLTQANVQQVLDEIQKQGTSAVDAIRLTQFDAAALALFLALRRQDCAVHNIPCAVLQLARVYGVDSVLLNCFTPT